MYCFQSPCSNATFEKLHFNVKSMRDFWIQLRLLWKSSDPDPREKVRIQIRWKKIGSGYDGKSFNQDSRKKSWDPNPKKIIKKNPERWRQGVSVLNCKKSVNYELNFRKKVDLLSCFGGQKLIHPWKKR